ncbi:hypothetical protein RB608_01645 [Nocardioides sp. LHD-245]|uniref:hypothetical protein n=1 Tax=Nocardioides sp. LHD-245 TaxID=3051387 RepID=UPI0027DFFD7B|nr:hypothetical protein [Nocardioides sp. LHD-245]
MRKQLLGLTTAALAVGTLSFGLATPAQADAWKTSTKVPFPNGTMTDVDVVSTGDGDAVAAAIVDGAVHAYTATDGVWSGHAVVRSDVDATKLVLASNGRGAAAVGWVENVAGVDRLRVSRQTGPASWTGLNLMTPSGTDVVGQPQLGVAGDGLVIAAATVDGEDIDNKLLVTEWPQGAGPGAPKTLSASDAWNPALDVNSKGEALIAYNYTGLINNVMTVSRRTPGQGWNLGDSTSNSGNIAAGPEVAISENGKGQVIYSVVSNAYYRAETSPVLTDGTALPGHLVSLDEDFASEPSVDIDDEGKALFAYVVAKDGTKSIRYATAADGAYPGNPATLTGTLPDAQRPIALTGAGGLRAIQHSGNSRVVTHYRTSQVQPFVPITSEQGHLPDTAADVDAGGNLVTIGLKPLEGAFARFLDAGGPSLALSQPGAATTLSTSIPLAWSVTDSLSGLQPGTDIYATSAAWNQAQHGAPAVVIDNAPGNSAAFPAVLGTSYCFQARATDTAGNGTTTQKRCTTVPLDDTALTGKKWKRIAQAGAFNDTATTAKKKGRKLALSGIQAKHLSLMVTKAKKGGKIKVTWNGTLLKKISLKGTGRATVALADFAGVQGGTLKIKVISKNGRKVTIDGLVAAK